MSIWATLYDSTDDSPSGSVRTYREGWSNHYPDHTDEPTYVLACCAPAWCVPGHEHDHYNPDVSTWMRLTVDGTSVYMYRDAVQQLRDTLTDWLAIAVVQPDPLRDPCEEWES